MYAEPAKSPVEIGAMLAGKYRVDRVLGAGGMGVVVAATHEELEQRVAIKFLLPGVYDNPDIVNRFVREARAASRLRSQHVAKVIDVGRLEGGLPYMVMEYLEGEDLGAVLRAQGPLPVELVCRYVLQASEAIAEAHAARIVHRDLKPANLFLTHKVNGEPLVKVLDFGVSKALEGNTAQLSLTRSQSLLGSPLYMSPEQMKSSKHVDARADIWSLGVIIYELLTGRYPFESETVPGLVFQVTMQDPTPPRSYRPDVPVEVERVIMRCLAKAPDNRFDDVAELAHALEPFAGLHARGTGQAIAAVLRASEGRPRAISVTNESLDPYSRTSAPEASPPLGSAPPEPPVSPVATAPLGMRAVGDASPAELRAAPSPLLSQPAPASRPRPEVSVHASSSGPQVLPGQVEAPVLREVAGAASAWGHTHAETRARRPLWALGLLGAIFLGGAATAAFAFRGGETATPDRGAASAPTMSVAASPAPPTSDLALVASALPAVSAAAQLASASASTAAAVGTGKPGTHVMPPLAKTAPSSSSVPTAVASSAAPQPSASASAPPKPSAKPSATSGFVGYE
jgi:serine/threonine-protein kinase